MSGATLGWAPPRGCCLRALRLDAGLSMGAMAVAVGMPVVDVSNIELGRATPTREQVDAMTAARIALRRATP